MNSPKEIAKSYVAVGAGKASMPIAKIIVLAILGGMFIAVAGLGATTAPATIASASLGKFIGAIIFPAGLALVLIAGAELFTGSSLIIISVLEKEATVGGLLKNWVFVYLGNFIGGVIVAWIAVNGHTFSLFGNGLAASAIGIAVNKLGLSFGDAFLRGVLCNFLVCLGVWMALAAKDVVGKIIGLFFPVMIFVLCGFEHSVANMYYIPAGIFAVRNVTYAASVGSEVNISILTWGNMIVKNLIPVTLGNIVGGACLVGVPYWFAYLRGENREKKTPKPSFKK
jgi:formate/nitrite transporter